MPGHCLFMLKSEIRRLQMTRSFALTDPRAASAAPASYYYPDEVGTG